MQGNQAYKMGINAYQHVQKETMSGRETEARVLAQAALKLKKMSGKLGLENPPDRTRRSI